MEFLLELLFEFFGEFILQFVFEALSEAGLHLLGRSRTRGPASPALAVFGYALLGAICGGLSLWIFPGFFIQSPLARRVGLVVTPLLAAGAITLLGRWRSRRGDEPIRLDKFAYAYVFALAMAAIRFSFASPG